ncbi:MAG: hypothetical protein HY917_02685, partial [Candidatus Diapherotrites archaeon]|nr:hypothetical protein [Candidatus Diapherotrites archaeon]
MQFLRTLAFLSVLLLFFGCTDSTGQALGLVKSITNPTQKITPPPIPNPADQLTKPAIQPDKPTTKVVGQSDLIVEDIWWEPANPVPGQAITYYARVKNTGSDRPYADMSGRPFYGFNIAFAFDSSIPNPLPSGYYGDHREAICFDQTDCHDMDPGKTQTVSFTWTYNDLKNNAILFQNAIKPVGQQWTARFLTACADAIPSFIPERDERNNCFTKQNVPLPTPRADLIIETVGMGGPTPDSIMIADPGNQFGFPLPGDALIYSAKVKNIGSDRPYANMNGTPFYAFNVAFAFDPSIPNPMIPGYYGDHREAICFGETDCDTM